MKSILKCAGMLCIAASLFSCKGKDAVELKTLEDSAHYCIGFSLAANCYQQGLDSLNSDAIMAGFNAFNPDEQAFPLALDQEAYGDLMDRFVTKLQEKELAKMKEEYAPQIAEGDKFLAENGKRDGVITTASGLQYEILTEGSGAKPNLGDTITVLYKGTLLDGTIFDQTIDNKTNSFALTPGHLIEGWIEAFPLLAKGTKAKLYIPYSLAYGEYGRVPIPPFSTLIFEVELKDVTKGAAPQMNPAAFK